MGFFDKLNIKKTVEEIRDSERDPETKIDVEEAVDPKEYGLFDRLAIDISDLVAPESADEEETYFKVGEDYTRTLFIHTYPTSVEDNWLREVLRFQQALDVSFYIQPLPIKPFLRKMRQQAAQDEAAVLKEREDGMLADAKREQRWQDTVQFIEAVEQDITKPFQVMVALTIRARSKEELDRITEELERRLNVVTTRKVNHRHKEGFMTTLPLMKNELADSRTMRPMHTQGLMSMFPFTSSELTHESGVLVGVNQITASPIILNRFMQPTIQSPNTAILGATGSGKSFFAKLEMLRWSYLGVPTIVLDPSGEYQQLTHALGGSNININLDSHEVINPLDFSSAVRSGHNALREKIASMVELLRLMMASEEAGGIGIDPYTRQLFENALQETYRRFGYLADDVSTQMGATSDQMPILSDVWQMLARIQKTNRNPQVQERLQPLLAAMQSFVGDGHLAPLFDQKTTIDLRSHFINFSYASLPRQYLPMAMFLVLEFLRTSFFTPEQQNSGVNRLLYVDEAQILMSHPATAHFLEYTARTCRKYGIGLTVMTQNVAVFALNDDGTENKVGTGILAACSIKVLLKQEPSETDAIKRVFKLTPGELSRLISAAAGEGLLYVDTETAWFSSRGMASDTEYAMLTTTIAERAAISAKEAEAETLQRVADDHRLQVGTEEAETLPRGGEDPFLPGGALPPLPPSSES
jgi:type IV secretory pathway VirB4 component